jgi:hypothetical protein
MNEHTFNKIRELIEGGRIGELHSQLHPVRLLIRITPSTISFSYRLTGLAHHKYGEIGNAHIAARDSQSAPGEHV